ncbi:hypothetical protein SELMODRAFT_420081 [Selaginella moellendorffii]|uniref:FHA domain-containing protein n=1 Tax=Selaginella moellendorffii TaxID=88036 RepID=D8SAH2_SELML|nr:hypothetical protein SELMODRAFT_420081 [Selaginella moellendorffii]
MYVCAVGYCKTNARVYRVDGAVKSQYAPDPFDAGRILRVDITLPDGAKEFLFTTGPDDPALGLAKKGGTEFNSLYSRMASTRMKLRKGLTTKIKEKYAAGKQLCGARGGGQIAPFAMFWLVKRGLTYMLGFESERERNAAIMLARRFAFDCTEGQMYLSPIVNEILSRFRIEPGTETTGRLEVDYSAPKAGTRKDNELEVTTGIPPEVESDDEIVRFSDVETMILDIGDNEHSAIHGLCVYYIESKRFYGQHQMTILRLEQSVNAVMQRYLTRKGAIAMLYGYHLKYLMVANEVSIGRRTQGNVIDVDLAQEGPANRVSRKQASIKIDEDGIFHLKNLGKVGVFEMNG